MKTFTAKLILADFFVLVGIIALATVLGGFLIGAIACIVVGLVYGFLG